MPRFSQRSSGQGSTTGSSCIDDTVTAATPLDSKLRFFDDVDSAFLLPEYEKGRRTSRESDATRGRMNRNRTSQEPARPRPAPLVLAKAQIQVPQDSHRSPRSQDSIDISDRSSSPAGSRATAPPCLPNHVDTTSLAERPRLSPRQSTGSMRISSGQGSASSQSSQQSTPRLPRLKVATNLPPSWESEEDGWSPVCSPREQARGRHLRRSSRETLPSVESDSKAQTVSDFSFPAACGLPERPRGLAPAPEKKMTGSARFQSEPLAVSEAVSVSEALAAELGVRAPPEPRSARIPPKPNLFPTVSQSLPATKADRHTLPAMDDLVVSTGVAQPALLSANQHWTAPSSIGRRRFSSQPNTQPFVGGFGDALPPPPPEPNLGVAMRQLIQDESVLSLLHGDGDNEEDLETILDVARHAVVLSEQDKADAARLQEEVQQQKMTGEDALKYVFSKMKVGTLEQAFDWLDFSGTGRINRYAFETAMVVLGIDLETITGMKRRDLFVSMKASHSASSASSVSISRADWAQFHEVTEDQLFRQRGAKMRAQEPQADAKGLEEGLLRTSQVALYGRATRGTSQVALYGRAIREELSTSERQTERSEADAHERANTEGSLPDFYAKSSLLPPGESPDGDKSLKSTQRHRRHSTGTAPKLLKAKTCGRLRSTSIDDISSASEHPHTKEDVFEERVRQELSALKLNRRQVYENIDIQDLATVKRVVKEMKLWSTQRGDDVIIIRVADEDNVLSSLHLS